MGFTLVLFLLIILLLGVLYLKTLSYLSYWEKRGVPVPVKPKPIVGNVFQVLTRQKSFGYFLYELYNKTKSLPYLGIFSIMGPSIVINDLDLIRTVLTKDFIHFTHHNLRLDEKKNPMMLNLFSLTGEAWKNMRIKLTPTFTTSKIKYMFKTVAECNIEMLEYIDKSLLGKDIDIIDFKELFATLNTDVIGSCAFGIECNSFKDPNSQFRRLGKKVLVTSPARLLFQFLVLSLPSNLRKYVTLSRREFFDFFYKLVEDTIKYRQDNNITRNDFMQLLIDLKGDGTVDKTEHQIKGEDGSSLTVMEIAAQVFVFFVAGFETSSTAASFTMYELALNPDIQDKVRKEIDDVLEKHGGNISYEALADMSYLSMVLDETLRKHSPAQTLTRVCTKKYNIPGTDITIEKETPLFISIMGIHRDPNIYPDPMKFDPERFTPENKASRPNFTYMPFGEGPRLCIGNRFGLVQSKLALVSILSKYQVEVCEKTQIPMKYDMKAIVLTAEGGVWLKVKPRSKKT